MFQGKEEFLKEFGAEVSELFGKPIEYCGRAELYEALVRLVSGRAAVIRTEAQLKTIKNKDKEVYYFSMEYLLGRLLKNYLIAFGAEDIVRDGLKDIGGNLDELYENEQDPGLGNGGLGRLAACYLDSAAMQNIPCVGMGMRYRFGFFKQKIVDGWQTEQADTWLDFGYPWETMKLEAAITVKYGGVVDKSFNDGKMSFCYRDFSSVQAVPYDVPVVGYSGKNVNLLRLWRAVPLEERFNLEAFNKGDYSEALRYKNEIEAITTILYPDDSSAVGRELRLKQEYFFVAAGIGSILRDYKARYGVKELKSFPERVAIHINDTHPSLCVAELMRLLLDEEHMEWDEAWKIASSSCSYTNHTILPEAMEKWPIDLFRHLLPRIYMIVEEIDRRFREAADRKRPDWQEILKATSILWDGQVRTANLSVICSHTVNGVSAIHTEILKTETLKDFYALTPQKFVNVTNGVSHRRFLLDSNPGLSRLITESLGSDWKQDASELSKLLKFENDPVFKTRLLDIKRENKVRLAQYIKRENSIIVNPDSIFDVQVKRMHAYKRQLLLAFKIMDMYNSLKENPNLEIAPTTFIVAGKAAKSYVFAKEIIKFVCSIADVVNSDRAVKDRLKVVFVENFGVSNAQLIYPAADVSEQVSTAGKEASGTGNMKFMFNGAITLGTADGANIEIAERVGEENCFIFGLNAEEVLSYYKNGGYLSFDEYKKDPRLHLICDQLTNGFYKGFEFNSIFDALLHNNDEYFVLKDFGAYLDANASLTKAYSDRQKWAKMSLNNIAQAGYFSSDRSIGEYAEKIWSLKK